MEFDKKFEFLPIKQQDGLKEIVNELKLKKSKIEVLHDHEKGNNFLGRIIKVQILGITQDNKEIEKKLVIKMASPIKSLRNIVPLTLIYKVEIIFYTKIIPMLKHLQDKYMKNDDEKFHFINCYKVHSVEFEEFLIMDDVTVEGYDLEPRNTTLSLEHTKLAIKNIAYLHSLSFALNKYNPEFFMNESQVLNESALEYTRRVGFFIDITVSHSVKYARNEKFKKIFEGAHENVVEKVIQFTTASFGEPYNVICHGDCWQNNIMFRNSKNGSPLDVLYLDWQLGKCCSPQVDLLHLLFSTSDTNLRKNHYQEMINLYHDTLKIQLKIMNCDVEEIYPKRIYMEDVKKFSQYGFILSIISSNLLVREGSDVYDVEILMKDKIPESSEMEYKSQSAINNFVERIESLADDFIELGLLE